MIDFHSHILPQIDDGSSSDEESLNMLQEAKKVGFNKIISTSHYIEQYYECEENERTILLNKLDNNVGELQLYLGSEIYISDKIIELIKERKASTINNSRYVLFELPMNTKTMLAEETVYKLIGNGYIPIIAHPERYRYVQENLAYVKKLSDMGAMFQSNYGSIIGLYGSKAKSTVTQLLKQDLIQFLGTDVHRQKNIYPHIPKIIKKLKKIISEDKIEEITTQNAEKVLNNEELYNIL